MAHSNATENYGLPQWIATDKPTFLGDLNSAFGAIDTQMKANSDASTNAVSTANQADSNATTALANASSALSTANSASTAASEATVIANQAKAQSTTAASDASTALRASAANSIENLAPAYDATRTYAVGELVTYVDAQNSGKLYKCIVAVTNPMEFNINYWDDVTTSEAFIKSDTATYDYQTGDTFSSIISGLFNAITSLNKVPKRLERYEGTSIRFYSVGISSSGALEIVNIRSEAGIIIFNTATHITSQNRDNWHNFNVSSDGTTFENLSDNTVTSDGYFKIYFE